MTKKTHAWIMRFAQHRVAANLLMLTMFLLGFFALFKLNTQFLPQYNVNQINVSVAWSGANAQDVERSIINPLEQELRNLDYLKNIHATARLGEASISLRFEQNTDMANALNQVRDRASRVSNLPQDAEQPIITLVEPFEPIARLIITGPKHLVELRPLVRRMERDLLDRGIAKVEIKGLPEQQIAVQIPTARLAELNLSLGQIAEQIKRHSQDLPAGTIGKNIIGQQIRILQQQRSVLGFEQLPITTSETQRILQLSDIANVKLMPKDREVLITYQEKPAIVMNLLRTENANTFDSANILNTYLKELKPSLGPNIHITVFDESWHFIQERIHLLLKNGAGGLILITIILLLFFNFQMAKWVAIGIPTSFLAALAILYSFGDSINMVSLFAFIMTLGIIVDDTIVVSEETMSQIQQGKSALESVALSIQKMLVPIVASSTTTIIAFIPLFIVGGIIGTIIFTIPLVVVSVIIASLIECFLVLPGHLLHSLKKRENKQEAKIIQNVNAAFVYFREHIFRKLVTQALAYREVTLVIAFGIFLFAISLILSGTLKFNFFPSPDFHLLHADAQFTAGTSARQIKQFTQQLKTALKQTAHQFAPQTKTIVKHALEYSNQTATLRSPDRGEQFAGLLVELSPTDTRTISNNQFIAAWRAKIKIPPGIENFTITTPKAGPPGSDIDIQLSNSNIKTLKEVALKLSDYLNAYPGVYNIKDNQPFGQEQLVYKLSATGKAIGLTIEDIGKQLRAAFSGELAQEFHTADDEIEVRVMLPDKERFSSYALGRLPIITKDGKVVPLTTVAQLTTQQGFDILHHADTKPTITVKADIDTRVANANEVLAQLQKTLMPQLISQYNVRVKYKGKAEEQADTLTDMTFGLGIALSLMYIVLAYVFASYGWPLIIMLSIPLGLTGAIFGHLLLGVDLTVLSLFGLFGLSGIVVNDSIILLTAYKCLRAQASSIHQAIIDAACERLRPVILTSITTIAGLTPLLLERSTQAQFLIPMAISISFGLMASTLLILVVIPCLLFIYEDCLKCS